MPQTEWADFGNSMVSRASQDYEQICCCHLKLLEKNWQIREKSVATPLSLEHSRGHTVESGEVWLHRCRLKAPLCTAETTSTGAADNWAPCRLQPQCCCLLELITITQKFPLKISTATGLYVFGKSTTEMSWNTYIKGPVTLWLACC